MENIGEMGFLDREAPPDVRKADVRHEFFAEGMRENRQMLATAENEVFKATADAAAVFREFAEPSDVVLYEFADGRIPVWRADAIHASGAKAPKHLSEMVLEGWKVFHHVMRVKSLDRIVGEWQGVSQVCPHVALASEHVGIDVDPARKVVVPPRA